MILTDTDQKENIMKHCRSICFSISIQELSQLSVHIFSLFLFPSSIYIYSISHHFSCINFIKIFNIQDWSQFLSASLRSFHFSTNFYYFYLSSSLIFSSSLIQTIQFCLISVKAPITQFYSTVQHPPWFQFKVQLFIFLKLGLIQPSQAQSPYFSTQIVYFLCQQSIFRIFYQFIPITNQVLSAFYPISESPLLSVFYSNSFILSFFTGIQKLQFNVKSGHFRAKQPYFLVILFFSQLIWSLLFLFLDFYPYTYIYSSKCHTQIFSIFKCYAMLGQQFVSPFLHYAVMQSSCFGQQFLISCKSYRQKYLVRLQCQIQAVPFWVIDSGSNQFSKMILIYQALTWICFYFYQEPFTRQSSLYS